ncbi:MAG: methionyl-tRNA formyltransferase [Verrucomicrobia bacterium]|nr:methionyl-tRNA formyltransferase [Verrucomicrobiota bacterium]
MAFLRVIFMGTAELSCESLRALIDSPDCQVVAVVTQPDRPKGRDLRLQPTPVKELALKANLPVLQPERARDEAFLDVLQELRPDLITVAAYGQILPKGILDLPRFGCLNCRNRGHHHEDGHRLGHGGYPDAGEDANSS